MEMRPIATDDLQTRFHRAAIGSRAESSLASQHREGRKLAGPLEFPQKFGNKVGACCGHSAILWNLEG
jgi:hypothetical protein